MLYFNDNSVNPKKSKDKNASGENTHLMLFYNALNGIGAKLLRPVHARPLRWQRWKGGRGKGKEGNPGQKGGRGRGGNLVSLAGLGTPGDPEIQGRMGLRMGVGG